MRKYLLIISIIIVIIITFTQGYDVRSVEELSYAIAIGLDKNDSTEEPLKLTLQIAKPDYSEGGGTKITTQTMSVNCNTIDIGLAMLNLKNINEINLSHCTALVISEDFAKEGIENYINTLANNIEIRPTCNILISQDSASDFLNTASQLEDISSKFYNSFINSSRTTSYITPCQLSEFYSNLNYDIKQPVAIYTYVKDDTIESLGLAVFKDYKMVGRLSGLDTICYNLLTNNFETATVEIYNTQNPSFPLTVSLSYLEDTQISVELENDKPKITCSINLESQILTANKSFDFSTEESLSQLEAEINKLIENSMLDFLTRTSTQYQSDIIGFEGYFNKNFLTQDEIDQYDWNYLYTQSSFEIKSQNSLVSGYLFSKN